MSEFKIEKDVPLVESQWGGAGGSKYPVAKMEIGDSFLLPNGARSKNASYIITLGKRNGKKLAARKTADGIRVWRVA